MKTLVIRLAFLCGAVALLPSCSEARTKQKSDGPALTDAVVKKLGFPKMSFTEDGESKWKLKNGVTVFSSYPYGQKIIGFSGPTPLFIAVDKQQKIIGMVAAPNRESPEYFPRTKSLLKSWNGKTLKEAAEFTPDATTGATFSSKAIIRTVHATAKAVAK